MISHLHTAVMQGLWQSDIDTRIAHCDPYSAHRTYDTDIHIPQAPAQYENAAHITNVSTNVSGLLSHLAAMNAEPHAVRHTHQ